MESIRRIRFLLGLGGAILLFRVAGAYGQSIPIINIDPRTQLTSVNSPQPPALYFGFNESHGNGMVGWSFTLRQPVTVTQVGWYDEEQDGLSRNYQVGLWQGAALASLIGGTFTGQVIPAGTDTALNGVYRVVTLSNPLNLEPGFYILGGLDSAATTDVIKFVNTQNYENEPSLTGSRLTIGQFFYASPSLPADLSVFIRPNNFYLLNGLELGPMLFISVPEPSTIGLTAFAAIGLIWFRRRSKLAVA